MIPFEDFWAEYPRKQKRIAAMKEWDKVSMFDHEAVMAGLRLYCRSLDWKDIQFVPHASTFLHQRRWEELPCQLRLEKVDRGGTHIGGAIHSELDMAFYDSFYSEHPELRPANWPGRKV